MDIFVGATVGVIVLTILVVIHELGHALVAKKHGVVVEEFGVGFPPRAWSKIVPKSFLGDQVTYSINWLPLGGFVKLKGENDSADNAGDFGAATFWQKTKILLAGVAMNWLTAAVLLTILATIGLPKVLPNQFYIPSDAQIISQPVELVGVSGGSPAEKAGLRQGDRIVRFANAPLDTAQSLSKLAENNKGKTVEVIYTRNNVESSTRVTLRADNNDKKGYLGASPGQQQLIKSSWSAPIVGVCTTAQMSVATVQGISDVLASSAKGLTMKLSFNKADRDVADKTLASVGDNMAGPVGIFGIIFPAAQKAGPTHVILLAAIISLTLAVMNILPIPALDGGRWFVMALFRLIKKPLSKDLEEKIHGTGFMLLMVLVVLITIADVGKFR